VPDRLLHDDEINDALDIYRRFLSPQAELPVELPAEIIRPLDERLTSLSSATSSSASSSRISLSIFDASLRHAHYNVTSLRRTIATLRS
jgi:hypothetical protein